MDILLIGAAGKLGRVLDVTLRGRGHHVTTVGRNSGDLRHDLTDPRQIAAMYATAPRVDAVVSALGEVPYKPLPELDSTDWQAAFTGKVLPQIELVRQGLGHVTEHGSFTLISGIPGREPVRTAAAAALANGAVEAFVRAAAVEIAPRRVNAVSPNVFTESLPDFGDFFPGMGSVDLAEVARTYVWCVEGAHTGRVHEL